MAVDEQSEQEAGQLSIAGTGLELSLDAGGEAPLGSSVKLIGGSMAVEGEFAKGDVVELLIRARVSHVEFADSIDNTGAVTSCERRHKMRMMSVRRLED